jgi:hypothetical protein
MRINLYRKNLLYIKITKKKGKICNKRYYNKNNNTNSKIYCSHTCVFMDPKTAQKCKKSNIKLFLEKNLI